VAWERAAIRTEFEIVERCKLSGGFGITLYPYQHDVDIEQ